jgi:2-keto-4-pentenoate hydratase/2-oxohepta-3-ene-1,7-dioic acid hydratase in catechol pathway
MELLFEGEHGEQIFELGTIYCAGRNYVDHVNELGNEIPTDPIIFMKPSTTLRQGAYTAIEYPPDTEALDYEGELVLLLRGNGRNIPAFSTADIIAGYAVGIDLTMRDLQSEAKEKGLPWTLSKGFDGAGQISHFVPFESCPSFDKLGFSLYVNGELRQRAFTNQMIFSPEMIVTFLSKRIGMKTGDILFTGTPAGTGRLSVGDKIFMQLHTTNPDEVLVDFHSEVIPWH